MRIDRWSALGLRPDPQRHLSQSSLLVLDPSHLSLLSQTPSLTSKAPPLLSCEIILNSFLFLLDFTSRHHQVRLGCHSFSSVIHVIVLKVLHGVRRFVHCGSRRRSPWYLLACPLVSTISQTISLRSFRRTLGNARLLFRCHRPVIPILRHRQCIQRNPS